MIVHTAVRKKVPLKKKVRSSNPKKQSKLHLGAKQKSSATKDVSSTQVPSTSIKPVQTIVTASGLSSANTTTVVTSTPQQVPVKRSSNMIDNSRKLLKKKKRSAPTPNESPTTKQDPEFVTVKGNKKPTKKSKLKQEIIDYSGRTENHSNTFGKVQKWLMDNPLVTNTPAPAQINHTTHVGKIINKSQSTPEGFVSQQGQQQQQTQPTHLQRSPKKAKVKTKSVGNINEKVKLQVVYKPPFKFSLKLSKNENNVKTQVVSGARSKGTRKSRIGDMKRVGASNREEPTSPKGPNQKRRSAILVRSAVDPIPTSPPELHKSTEPTYETLTPKSKDPAPAYENLQLLTKSPSTSAAISAAQSINTATFRISKSASGGAILMPSSVSSPSPVQNIPKNLPTTAASQHSFNKYVHNSNSKGNSANNLNQIPGHSRRSSLSNNLTKQNFGGSSQNLMRSSTTNLTKANRNSFHIKPQNYELNRSSTTNLTKEHHGHHRHHGSHVNLRRGSTDDLPGRCKT